MNREEEKQAIKATVQEYYGRSAAASCCEVDSRCCGSGVISSSDGSDVRVEETGSMRSWGCGDPVGGADLNVGEVVLDLGSGGGLDVFRAAQQVGPDGFVYGLDMTEEMLELARINAKKIGVENVEFLNGDIEEIPLPDRSVDVIISNCVVNLTPDKREAIREAWRVLRPGGRLAISDIVIDGGLDGLNLEESKIRSMLSWVACIAGALTHAQFRDYLAEVGFEQIQIEVKERLPEELFLPLVARSQGILTQGDVAALAQRFTSSTIRARRPA